MNILSAILAVLIYVVVFFVIERVSFKDSDKFVSKVLYACGFSILVIAVNIVVAVGPNRPHIGITLFLIGVALSISIGYIIWQYSKKHKR